ncbi:MAG TPA: acetylornithine/succinylornithine family transaminase [Phycisphaerae bacterium]|nr:acetylornithine/succinylornithine family transaminase [Phycisphaerae bacterium]
MSNQEFIARHQSALTLNYGKLPATLVRGEGSRLWDADGREFIDLFAGFGGTILGHAHPALVAAVTRQASTLWCTGNQFYTEPQIRLAESLKRQAFDGRAFFCHSGAEANEAAIKLARLTSGMSGGKEGRYKVISMQRGFHGRTLGALSATPTLDYQKGFFPLVPGFSAVPFDDLAALEAAIDPDTCAVITEPLQGEGGIYVPSDNFLRGVRELCTKHKLAMIVDEVWTGCARTGKPFAHQHASITPDIMTLGKALGGGLPTGCMFSIPERAACLKPGTHGCTLGGNPICAAAAATVMETIEKENLSARAQFLGEKAVAKIRAFSPQATSKIKEIRGQGLMLGIELHQPDASTLPATALAQGLLINVTHKNVIRLAPALTIPENTLMQGLTILEATLAAL